MGVLEWGPWEWQGTDFSKSGAFFNWCDYVENAVNETNKALLPGTDGVDVQKALDGYAKWIKTILLPDFCYNTFGYDDFTGVFNLACWNSYNASSPLYTDTSVSNTWDRQWW